MKTIILLVIGIPILALVYLGVVAIFREYFKK